MTKQEKKLYIALAERLCVLLDLPESKETSKKIIRTCEAIEDMYNKSKAPIEPPKQLGVRFEGDTVYVD